jgi:hypothetical protein
MYDPLALPPNFSACDVVQTYGSCTKQNKKIAIVLVRTLLESTQQSINSFGIEFKKIRHNNDYIN